MPNTPRVRYKLANIAAVEARTAAAAVSGITCRVTKLIEMGGNMANTNLGDAENMQQSI